jgi:hypothetical protein
LIYKFAAKRGSQVVKVSSAVSLDINQEQTALNANAATATQPANSQAIKAKEAKNTANLLSIAKLEAFQVLYLAASIISKFLPPAKTALKLIGISKTAAADALVFMFFERLEEIHQEEK